VGLDLVVRRVEEVGGEIRASSQPGSGITFEISIPRGISYARLLFFRYGNDLFAMPGLAVTDVRRIGKGELKRNSAGSVFYLGSPAFAGDAPAKIGESTSFGSFAIVVSYLGRDVCVLADDVLFEHEVQEDLINDGGEGRRMAVTFGSGKREFIFLPPSVLHPVAE
jgi:chemotaxis protein histidine kinase CheA